MKPEDDKDKYNDLSGERPGTAPDDPLPESPGEETDFIRLMDSTNQAMSPPDADFLARLKERSTQAFLEAAQAPADSQAPTVPTPAPSTPSTPSTSSTPSPLPRRPMFAIAWKTVSACLAAGVVIVGAVLSYLQPHQPGVAFGEVLDRLSDAQSLHLVVARQGETSDVWYSQPNLVRWEDSDGKYRIAHGNSLWQIDEQENRATRESTALFDDGAGGGGVALWSLLDSDSRDVRQAIQAQVPSERIERNGREMLRYELRLADRSPPLTIDALVDAKTLALESLAVQTQQNGQQVTVTELTVVAQNKPVAAEKFVVRDTLTEDGRVGTVMEVQGLVSLRPVMHDRWTPLCGKTLVRPGDWIRTDNRGANAVVVSLVKQSQLILGPGTLVEVISPAQVRVHAGELEATVGETDKLTLVGPGDEQLTVETKPDRKSQVFRVKNDKLARLDHEPAWLKGFKGAAPVEMMGSLIAKVDGRDVPLTVGYHTVRVDIRDQIARTEIEESFVNHTNGILEGVFYFPLPDDASISGFGMWIGNELVEADIVEKQRAREIYETILRERRDPGLLEWTGGNLFKARVFPIPANAEKRVKISYTQVLPLRGSSYRYSYALQSELLKLNPLRELSIDVKVNSAAPLKNVSSPTHTVRADKTAHSGHVEFSAQEYTPTRDFEVVVETDRRQADLIVIPHRRGDDGYFMIQLTPPAAGDWKRDVLPNGQPLELLILADTSASMDAGQRRKQAEVVSALLASLTPKDRVNLAGCDVECDWAFPEPVAAEPGNIEAVRKFLEKRKSLGWTDLDQAFTSAFRQATAQAHIVYIGDGIVTTGDARPEGFAQRLQQLYDGKGICHAIAVGSSFEPAVLKTISGLGGGSLRKVTGEEGPAAVAAGLLREISQPALRDLKVEFRGFQAARVYPEQLTNLPAGSQQILLGLYQPGKAARDQQGEVVVTATQDGKRVKFSAPVSFQADEQGNSFIPRLWARMHLDSLLAQGAGPSIRDEIIALSEEYQIMTPYTSFLVLESDADRARFKVQRRFRIRDGEKYFQQGRDNANFELTQQQMQRAGNWRLGLRRMALARVALMGRDVRAFTGWQPGRLDRWYGPMSSAATGMPGGMPMGGSSSYFAGDLAQLGDFGVDDGRDSGLLGLGAPQSGRESLYDFQSINGPGPGLIKLGGKDVMKSEGEFQAFEPEPGMPFGNEVDRKALLAISDGPVYFEKSAELGRNIYGRSERDSRFDITASYLDELYDIPSGGESGEGYGFGIAGKPYTRDAAYAEYARYPSGPDYLGWVNALFPVLPAAEIRRPALPRTPVWPDAARALSNSLLRTDALAKLPGGLEITREAQSFEPRWNELTGRHQRVDLWRTDRWLTRTAGDGVQTIVHWADAAERGVIGLAYGLGQVRKSHPTDLSSAALDRSDISYLGLNDHSLAPLHEAYRQYVPKIERLDENRTLLILTQPRAAMFETRVVIDTARHVIVSIDYRQSGKTASALKFDDFVEVAGMWWAQRLEVSDDVGRRTWLVTQTVKAVAAEALAERIIGELAVRDRIQLLHAPLPDVKTAKAAQAQLGRLTFDDQFVLLLHFVRSQQWQKVFAQLEACERLSAGKPGVRWVRYALQSVGRRHGEWKTLLTDEVQRLVNGQSTAAGLPLGDPQSIAGDELFLANYLLDQASSILESNESLTWLDSVKPAYERQPAHRLSVKAWRGRRLGLLQNSGQPEASLREQQQLAADYPRDYSLQQQYAQTLFSNGDYQAAYDWLAQALAADTKWHEWEADSLRNSYTSFLQQQGRYADLAKFVEQQVARNPENQTVYQQYLSALIQSDQVPRYEALLTEWLQAGTQADELSLAATARLQAAISLAFGQGHYVYTNRLDEKWQPVLAEIVVATARSKRDLGPAQQIMNHWQFQATDACRSVRGETAKLVVARVADLPPNRLQMLLNWIMPNDPPVADDTWQAIAKGLRARWDAEPDADLRHELGGVLVHVLTSRPSAGDLLAFLREQLTNGPKDYRESYANQLFNTLLSQAWSAPIEDEAFALLDRLSAADEPGEQLKTQVAALYRLADAMVQSRDRLVMNKLEQDEQHTKKPDRERAQIAAEQLNIARLSFADRLKQEQPRRGDALGAWLRIERLYLEVLAERALPNVATECWDLLSTVNARRALAAKRPADQDQSDELANMLDRVLQSRCEATLMSLASRPTAPAELVARLRKYLDDQMAAEPDVARWKTLKFQLLLVLDQPQELRQVLTAWVKGDDAGSRWRLALGYVLAELGAIPDAIALFEAVEIGDEISPQAWRVLSGWYLAANRRADHERAQIRVYQTLDEWRLNQFLHQQLNPWQSGGQLPSQLDQQVLLMFTALFEKSGQPQNYLWMIQQFYQASHDFRLLAVLADSVIGHTPGKVYPFVQGMHGVLSEIRDEATADELREKVHKVRERATTTVDKRALDILEALVERRAAEVQNQPGPHIAAALACLQRAFERDWQPGEHRLMADLLAGLGMISAKPLADEQLRQMQTLFELQPRRTYDRLHVAHRQAELWSSYNRWNAAVDLLRAELADFEEAHNGILPVSANNALASLIHYQSVLRHYAGAEKTVLDQLRHPVHGQQRLWLEQRRFDVYYGALENDGEVSVGSGVKLFQVLERQLLDSLQIPDHNHRYQVVNLLCSVYRVASTKKVPGAHPALKAFALKVVPEVLSRQTSNYTSIVNQVAQTLHDVVGVREALAFLIERIEHEPGWFPFNNQDGWAQSSSTLAHWRLEVKSLGDLDARLLKIVLAELRRDLTSQQQRNRVMYSIPPAGHLFWKEKEADFARVAEEVYAERQKSGAAVQYLADYVCLGLGRSGQAIEMLFIAHRAKLLDEAGLQKLITFLHSDQRYGESIALLEPLIDAHPDNIQYRVWLMQSYYFSKRPAELRKLLADTDAHFHLEHRWTDHVLAELAACCLQTQLYAESVKYYQELIPRHEASQPGRGIGNGTLSSYYAGLAQAHGGLKQTAEAVDAACGAIISWGPTNQNRGQAIESLKQVLRLAPDLKGYVATLDRATDTDGADRPIVRKALGQVLAQKAEYAQAIVQLQRALALEPNDLETQKELIACYDNLKDKAGAIEQILQMVEVSRRDIQLFKNLAERLVGMEQPQAAERAYTSIVEALPSESESHFMLAEIREQQNRWPEAIVQWTEVARIRELEPTGLLRLAAAQIHEKQLDAARHCLRKLETTPWPLRFGDVAAQARALRQTLETP